MFAPEDLAADLLVADPSLEIERADIVRRPDTDRPPIDTLLVVRRPDRSAPR